MVAVTVGIPEELNLLDNEAYRFRRPRQARGKEKFNTILQTADALIVENGAEELSLYDIAERAEVAVGSVYHFFPSKYAVLLALIEFYDQQFADLVSLPLDNAVPQSWQDVIWQQTERSREFINATPGALIMILGSGQTWATRLRDAVGDRDIAKSMAKAIEQYFQLPEHPAPERILFNSIRMLEGFWATSYMEHGHVTDEWAAETQKAQCAYLGLYWPPFLPSAAA